MTESPITPRHRAALQSAINGVRQQALILGNPHDYVTETEAGLIVSIAALFMQVSEVEGGADLGATATMGNSAPTAGHAAVETALASVADPRMADLVSIVNAEANGEAG